MKSKLFNLLICAIIVLPACSSKLNTGSAFSGNAEKTLRDVIKEKIKGFNIGTWPTSNPPRAGLTGGRAGLTSVPFVKKMGYKIFDRELHLVIDGTDVEQFYIPDISENTGDYVRDRNQAPIRDRMRFIENYLVNIRAEDVTDVRLLSDQEYNEKYKYELAKGGSLPVPTADFAYVEVTTRLGNGAFMK